MSARTLAEFREMVEKRRLEMADEIYHEWVERVFKERDKYMADSDYWYETAEDNRRECDDLRAQLPQRRDFTLTAVPTASQFVNGGYMYEVRDSAGKLVASALREHAANDLERWSREGAEPERCKKCGTWIPCVDCFNKQTTDKPPASDYGMYEIKPLGPDWLRDRAAQLLQPFLYTGRFNEPRIERVREIVQAIRDYVLEVNNGK